MRAFAYSTLVLAATTFNCKKPDESVSATKPVAAPVKVASIVATEAPAPDVLTLTGVVIADQRSDVTADTQGKVVNVMIERGQHVKIGQAVIQLDVRSAALSAREAQATLASAKAQKDLAAQECVRTKQLLDKGAITQSEFDRQNTACLNAVDQVSAAQARTEMMSKSVADGLVRAPFDGVVSEKFVSPGEWVAPGKALFTLVDSDPLKIELSVPEKAVSAVQKDQRLSIVAVAHPDKTYGAVITRLAAEIGKSRSLTVEATLDKGSDLVPGMFAEAHVTIGQTPRVVLPATAIIRRDKTWHAFVVRDGQLDERIVQVGSPPADGQISIIQGITKGEKVVAKATEQLADGQKVVE